MTSSPSNNFEELTTDEKCDYLFELVQESFKKQGEFEERIQFLEKIIAGTYPSAQELKRFLDTPHTAWEELWANNDNLYNSNFLEWIYVGSKSKWEDEKFPSAKQVNYALRLLDEYERKKRLNILAPTRFLRRIRHFFRKK